MRKKRLKRSLSNENSKLQMQYSVGETGSPRDAMYLGTLKYFENFL